MKLFYYEAIERCEDPSKTMGLVPGMNLNEAYKQAVEWSEEDNNEVIKETMKEMSAKEFNNLMNFQ